MLIEIPDNEKYEFIRKCVYGGTHRWVTMENDGKPIASECPPMCVNVLWRGCAEQVEQGVTCEQEDSGVAALNKWSEAELVNR